MNESDEIAKLVEKLNGGEITPDDFKKRIAELTKPEEVKEERGDIAARSYEKQRIKRAARIARKL